jgi:hypothetical protein
MTHWTDAADLLDEREGDSRSYVLRAAPGALAFLLSAALGVYMVYLRPLSHLFAPPPPPDLAVKSSADAFGGLAPVVPPPSAAGLAQPTSNPFGDLVLQGFGSPTHFEIAENPAPEPPVPPEGLRAPDDGIPLPPRRPSELAREPAPTAPSVARLEPKPTPMATPAPGLFEKLFGGVGNPPKAADSKLAYAPPPPPMTSGVSTAMSGRNGGLGGPGGPGGFLRGLNFGSGPTARFGDKVAVYDISAHVVYLPDGTRLEAHSGLGPARDDPSRVNERMRGATPPATYALTPRGGSFHGVDALRLTPVDGAIYGRAGLLAHTYMLGPDGDSNGCVSFRDYDAFLRAYRNGQINKLVVVTRL